MRHIPVRRALKWVAAAADQVHPAPRGVVVLLYHRVGARTGVEVDLPADLFARQMEVLAQRGGAVGVAAALDAVAGGATQSPDPVVVTFDDGTEDFAEVAAPILDRYRIPATLYVATDFVERGRPFPDHGRPLSWAALSDVLASGLLDVGSHTHRHTLLDRCAPPVAADELDRSIGLIEDRLGRRPLDFAYPKAVLGSPEAEALVRGRFRSAAVGGMRPNPYGRTDPHRLSRSAVQVSDGMRWFACKLAGGMATEDALRRVLNRRRYAGSVT